MNFYCQQFYYPMAYSWQDRGFTPGNKVCEPGEAIELSGGHCVASRDCPEPAQFESEYGVGRLSQMCAGAGECVVAAPGSVLLNKYALSFN